MPLLFQRQPAYTPDQAFTNLFRLIDGFDNYSREVNNGNNAQACGNSKVASRVPAGLAAAASSTRAFNPRFDVRETESAYELHGELPGVDRNNVSIEFSDPQTLVVSGRVERNYEAEQPQQDQAPAQDQAQAQPEATAARSPSLRATVEDEDTDSFKEVGDEAVLVEDESAGAQKEEAAAAAATPKEPAVTTTTTTTEAAATAKPVRYWYRERSVGQFRRVFEFPVAVNEDAVKASLDGGILSVSIPKAAKRQAKRISVF